MPSRRPGWISPSMERSTRRRARADIAREAAAGVAAFKFSTFGTDPVRFPRISPPLLAEAFAEVAKTG